jgi:hypothetical protein
MLYIFYTCSDTLHIVSLFQIMLYQLSIDDRNTNKESNLYIGIEITVNIFCKPSWKITEKIRLRQVRDKVSPVSERHTMKVYRDHGSVAPCT